MIHDDIPSSAPGQPSNSTSSSGHDGDSQAAAAAAGRTRESDGHNGDASSPATAAMTSAERDRLRKIGLGKKLHFMTDLMRSLDMIVFAEMCAMYYMECSFPRLFLRVVPHYFFLTPKSEDFVLLLPAHRPHVVAVFVPNLLCMLLHLVLSLPTAGEATRGYLHGGIIIDFIGQKAPESRWALLAVDVVILAIQCLMLAVHQEREALRKRVYPATRSVAVAGGGNIMGAPPPPGTQDHDAEERGVLNDEPAGTSGETDEIEMRNMSGEDGGQDTTRLLEGSSLRRAPANADLLGVLRSGNAVLADFHVVHTIRTVGNDYERAAAYSLQTIGYTATLAARAAERRRDLEARRQR